MTKLFNNGKEITIGKGSITLQTLSNQQNLTFSALSLSISCFLNSSKLAVGDLEKFKNQLRQQVGLIFGELFLSKIKKRNNSMVVKKITPKEYMSCLQDDESK